MFRLTFIIIFSVLTYQLYCQVNDSSQFEIHSWQYKDISPEVVPTKTDSAPEHVIYCNLLSAGFGQLISPNTSGLIQVSFPYTVTDQSGHTSKQQFVSNLINPSRPSQPFGTLSLEIGGLKNAFNIYTGGSFYNKSSQFCFGFGYGRNYFFNLFKAERSRQKYAKTTGRHFYGRLLNGKSETKRFMIQPSINFCYSEIGWGPSADDNYLGSIDNENKTINLLGFESDPSYSRTSGKNQQTTYTYNVKTLNVYYGQNVWTLFPKISLQNNHYEHTFHWELNIGYYFPFSKKEGILLYQDTGDHQNENPVASRTNMIGLNNFDIKTSVNNKGVSSTPYTFSGLYIGAAIGFNLSYRNVHKSIQ